MKALFPGYYQNSNEERIAIWKNAVFVFDASVLLNVPQFDQEGQDRFFEILQKLKYIWLPHQFAYEYHKNRYNALSNQLPVFDEVKDDLVKLKSRVDRMKELVNRKEELLSVIANAIEIADSIIEEKRKSRSRLLSDDIVTQRIVELFGENVGKSYPENNIDQFYTAIERRYSMNVPPGYKDASSKDAPGKYGDALAWLQIIDYACQVKKNIVLVTNEKKEDWWIKDGEGVIAPRQELRQELMEKAGVHLVMHRYDRFLRFAEEFLKLPEKPEVIEEAKEIIQKDDLAEVITSQNVNIPGYLHYDTNDLRRKFLFLATKSDGPLAESAKRIFDEIRSIQTHMNLNQSNLLYYSDDYLIRILVKIKEEIVEHDRVLSVIYSRIDTLQDQMISHNRTGNIKESLELLEEIERQRIWYADVQIAREVLTLEVERVRSKIGGERRSS